MIRRVLKRQTKNGRLQAFLDKYKIPKESLSASRKAVTRGIGIGLFIAFIPMPAQMLLVVALVPFLRFNVPLAIAMVWISNPVTMPFMYYLEYLTGGYMLGMRIEEVELSVEWFSNNLHNIFVPLYVGAFFYSFVVSIAIYYIIDRLWIYSVYKQKKRKNLIKVEEKLTDL